MQKIPLSNSPNHTFLVTVSVNGRNAVFEFFLSYNEVGEYWTLRIKDSTTGTVILDSVPLLTDEYPDANFLSQYAYLRIGNAYIVRAAPADTDFPDNTNLGTLFLLVWGDNTEYYEASSVAEAVTIIESLSDTGTPYGIVQLEGERGPRGLTGPYNEIDVADAQAAQAAAEAARDESETWTLLAEQWATNPEDDPVELSPNLFSAFHWAVKAAADAVQTAADRVQTGLDVVQTAADRVQTGLDAVDTAADAVATAADRVQTGLDAVATAADRVQTGLDAVAAAADAVQTAADRVQTGLDVTAAEAAQGLAEDAQVGAEAAEINAAASEAWAEAWAENPEDDPVVDSPAQYSAYHWSKKAQEAAEAIIDALVYKGAIDCSGNPNYPAADAGWTYKVSVAGKIGGASGIIVQVGDTPICFVDSSAEGDQAAVGANWNVLQANIVSLEDLIVATAESDFIVSGPNPFTWAIKTLANTKSLLHAAPGPIGGTTPDAGTFTTLTGTKNIWVAATELTIAAGAITSSQSLHTVDTAADDATDDLDTINGGTDGQLLAIRAAHVDRTVVIKHEIGNISTGGTDITLDDLSKYVLFVYDNALSKWVVIGGAGG
ncbi:MAG: hypothetical protein KKD44_29290, partial [Proteobacteria bacterium]|nr:hypothetical protein [Pseudomonadota bacterium]